MKTPCRPHLPLMNSIVLVADGLQWRSTKLAIDDLHFRDVPGPRILRREAPHFSRGTGRGFCVACLALRGLTMILCQVIYEVPLPILLLL